MNRKLSVAFFAAASAVSLSACSSGSSGNGHFLGLSPSSSPTPRVVVFDEKKMARDIEQSKQGAALGAVTCPADEVVKKGRTFDCSAADVTIHIAVTSDQGGYTWTPESESADDDPSTTQADAPTADTTAKENRSLCAAANTAFNGLLDGPTDINVLKLAEGRISAAVSSAPAGNLAVDVSAANVQISLVALSTSFGDKPPASSLSKENAAIKKAATACSDAGYDMSPTWLNH